MTDPVEFRQITFRQYPPDGHRFAANAFDRTIGKVVPFTGDGHVKWYGRITAVVVAPDGTWADFTADVHDLPDDDPDDRR